MIVVLVVLGLMRHRRQKKFDLVHVQRRIHQNINEVKNIVHVQEVLVYIKNHIKDVLIHVVVVYHLI